MSHKQQVNFCLRMKSIFPSYFQGMIADIGSADINGNNRHLFKSYGYIGYDLWPAKNVDVLMSGSEIGGHWDFVISTESLEHDSEWAATVTNMTKMVRDSGMLLITCATHPRPEHGTFRTSSSQYSPATSHYYQNLTKENLKPLMGRIPYQYWETDPVHGDLYFVGFKRSPKIQPNRLKYLWLQLKHSAKRLVK